MTFIPLDPFSEVVDERRRWTPDWYTWIGRMAAFEGIEDLDGPAPYFPVMHPSSGNFIASGNPIRHGLAWTDSNLQLNADVIQFYSDDPSGIANLILSGTPTVGDLITLTFKWGAGAHNVSVSYTVQPTDISLLHISNELTHIIALNSELFNLNGCTVASGAVAVPTPTTTYGGYLKGHPIGYVVSGLGGVAIDYDLTPGTSGDMSFRYTTTAHTTVITVAGLSSEGVDHPLPRSWDNNPVMIFGREIPGVLPPANSIIAAIYTVAASDNSNPLAKMNTGYGALTFQVENSSFGALAGRWVFQTTNTAGNGWSGTWFIGRGLYSSPVGDKGLGTINLPASGGYFIEADNILGSQHAHGDSDYLILSSDLPLLVTAANLTAPRAWTLPPANSVLAGRLFTVSDQGGINGANTLTIKRAGADAFVGVGVVGNAITMNVQFQAITMYSNGVNRWTLVSKT